MRWQRGASAPLRPCSRFSPLPSILASQVVGGQREKEKERERDQKPNQKGKRDACAGFLSFRRGRESLGTCYSVHVYLQRRQSQDAHSISPSHDFRPIPSPPARTVPKSRTGIPTGQRRHAWSSDTEPPVTRRIRRRLGKGFFFLRGRNTRNQKRGEREGTGRREKVVDLQVDRMGKTACHLVDTRLV